MKSAPTSHRKISSLLIEEVRLLASFKNIATLSLVSGAIIAAIKFFL